jgi:hypothetical protein
VAVAIDERAFLVKVEEIGGTEKHAVVAKGDIDGGVRLGAGAKVGDTGTITANSPGDRVLTEQFAITHGKAKVTGGTGTGGAAERGVLVGIPAGWGSHADRGVTTQQVAGEGLSLETFEDIPGLAAIITCGKGRSGVREATDEAPGAGGIKKDREVGCGGIHFLDQSSSGGDEVRWDGRNFSAVLGRGADTSQHKGV